ncbi:SAF domain-containing protein [Rhodococcus sp. HNM0569]|uniref:SAF domain-containing protein n=1 Tax=Rhodococcus sp. HNM0569 TaxID=2716340 RepID=UPI00146CDFD0|nr:SAF domain-containing protein [Rhodococcus sp. HNM0569]NLU82604.1 flagellar biosynthesis protein FlgA [Rhodococcus sp. HNM0569]
MPRPDRSLAPSLADRFADRLSWARIPVLRKIAAGVLAAAAVVVALRGDPSAAETSVVVAARDLAPGSALAADDVTVAALRAGDVPSGATPRLDDVTGRVLTGPVRAGEVVTDVRVMSPRLAAATTGIDDARVVPVRLADEGVTGLLREGDRVDVLAAGSDTDTARVVATGAVVVLVTASDDPRASDARIVMLALAARDAQQVAAASLTDALTVTVR